MDISAIKNELHNFMDKLYGNLKEDINECGSLEEISGIFEEEHENINDYKRVLQSDILEKIKSELLDKNYDEDITKVVEEIKQDVNDINISDLEIDENNIYIEEEPETKKELESIVIKNDNQKKKPTKAIIVICGILLGFLFGVIIKRDMLNGIIMGFIGAAFGFSAYEMYFAEDNKNLEKLIIRDRTINKRLDKNYLNTLIEERNKNIETILINYIDEFNNVLEKKVKN